MDWTGILFQDWTGIGQKTYIQARNLAEVHVPVIGSPVFIGGLLAAGSHQGQHCANEALPADETSWWLD